MGQDLEELSVVIFPSQVVLPQEAVDGRRPRVKEELLLFQPPQRSLVQADLFVRKCYYIGRLTLELRQLLRSPIRDTADARHQYSASQVSYLPIGLVRTL